MTNRNLFMGVPKWVDVLRKQLPILLLIGVIALGTYARLARSGDVPLCMDEAWRITSLLDAESLATQMFAGMNRIDPPFFSLMIFLLGTLYNVEFVLRLVSIIPGILTVPLAYLVGRHLFSSRWLAVLCSFLTAFSFDLLVFSKELKPYSLCAFVHLGILYGYLRYRQKITVRTTIAFTILLALSVPLSMNSVFAFPGVYLALFAGAFLLKNRKQQKLVLTSCIVLLALSALCFFLLIANIEDDGSMNYIQDYWDDYFCPTESWQGAIAWLAPRYIEHYSDLAIPKSLAPRHIADYLHLIYPALALLGFLALLLRSRRRFFEAVCLFIVPLAVMAAFSMAHQWPFGQLRMNIFVVFYVLFPPLYILDELGKSSVRLSTNSRVRRVLSSIGAVGAQKPGIQLAPMVPLIVCGVICIQFPADLREFSHSRIRESWQASAPALEHILDIYTEGPQIPLVCNHLGQAPLIYYSTYHRQISARYEKQAGLFDLRGMDTRSSSFYLRGAMLRVCQESRQAAIYLTHFLGGEAMIHDNDFCIEHDGMKGRGSYSCLITSEIFDAARHKQQIFDRKTFSGASSKWKQVYLSPPLNVEDTRQDSLVVFNFDLDFHSDNKKLRLVFLDQDNSTDSFENSSTEYNRPVRSDHLESAAYVKLNAPVEYVRLSISARDSYDFTIKDLEFFAVNDQTWESPDQPFQIVEDMCERIQLAKRIKGYDNFWKDRHDGFGWTGGKAVIELEEMVIEPTERVLMLDTYGWMKPGIRDDIMGRGLKIYINGYHRALLMGIEEQTAQKYYFTIPADVRSIRSITIKSRTFNPKKRGISDDDRSLGIDVKSIAFPRIVRGMKESNGLH